PIFSRTSELSLILAATNIASLWPSITGPNACSSALSGPTRNTTRSTRPKCEDCAMEIRPIRSDADYRSALKEIERLWDAELGTAEAEHVEVLSTLVEAYETKDHRIQAPDPIAAIEFVMEQKGLTRRDGEPAIGSGGRVSG